MLPSHLTDALSHTPGASAILLLVSGLFLLLLSALAASRTGRRRRAGFGRRRPKAEIPTPRRVLCQPKPKWVRKEILRLAAHMPMHGCRKIAAAFNRLHHGKESVGKSYVADTIRAAKLEILRLRRDLKHRVPGYLPRNLLWALDLTFLPDDKRPVLAIIDHGTRACLLLCTLSGRTSLHVLAALVETVRRFGLPRYLRTDNESSLVSFTMRLALALLGIRHQRSEPLCPWQNGRVERFFSTFKERLRPWLAAEERHHTQTDLHLFRLWYNHFRPHQHLEDATPAEAWDGLPAQPHKEPYFFSAWADLLAGFYTPR